VVRHAIGSLRVATSCHANGGRCDGAARDASGRKP
jgi:hypothetical protein